MTVYEKNGVTLTLGCEKHSDSGVTVTLIGCNSSDSDVTSFALQAAVPKVCYLFVRFAITHDNCDVSECKLK